MPALASQAAAAEGVREGGEMTASSPWFISALLSGFPAEREQGKLASVRRAGSHLSNKAAITRPSEAAWPKESWVSQPLGFIDGHRWLYLSGCWFCKFPCKLVDSDGFEWVNPKRTTNHLLVDVVQPGVLLLNCSALGPLPLETVWSIFYGSINFLRLLGSGCMNGLDRC